MSDTNTVVLLGTRHSIQRGEKNPEAFRSVLMDECIKYKIVAIAEEIHIGIDTVALALAEDLNMSHLCADPDEKERNERGIISDPRFDIVNEYGNKYPEIRVWPNEPSLEKLPAEVLKEYKRRTDESYRMREGVWLENITNFNKWPLLFVCGADHVYAFYKLLKSSGLHVIKSHEDWEPVIQ